MGRKDEPRSPLEGAQVLDTGAGVRRYGRVHLDQTLLQGQQDLNEDWSLKAHKIGGVVTREDVQELIEVLLELRVELAH